MISPRSKAITRSSWGRCRNGTGRRKTILPVGRTSGFKAPSRIKWDTNRSDNFHVKEVTMFKLILTALIAVTLAAGPAWALFETNKELVASAKIPLEEAVKSAVKVVPGKAAEADLGKDDGRTIWKIEVIDHNNKSQTVYVDAQTGMAR